VAERDSPLRITIRTVLFEDSLRPKSRSSTIVRRGFASPAHALCDGTRPSACRHRQHVDAVGREVRTLSSKTVGVAH
jgi:hypothetical protein